MKECNFEGCDKPHSAKGYCQGHYLQHYKGKELTPLHSTRRIYPEGTPCGHTGCPNPIHSNGYCSAHYGQFKEHGRTWEIGKRRMKRTEGYTEVKTCATCEQTKHYTKFVLGMGTNSNNYAECRDCYRARILPPDEPKEPVSMESIVAQIDAAIAKKKK